VAVGSSGSAPAIAPSIRPQSSALRHIGPRWSSDAASSNAPKRDTRPQVGLSPVTPQAADGKRIEPPVSVPIEPKHSIAAVATPDPLDDEPVHAAASHGLRGGTTCGWCAENAASVICSLPSSTAPASRSRRTTVPSTSGTKSANTVVPAAVGTPRVQHRSLTATGTPASGPTGSPRASRASTSAACASASSGVASA
jgi:hypothetical protein